MNVYEGMAAVTKAVSHIAKQSSSGVSYEFRGVDAVMNHLHGPLADNDLFLSPRVLDDWSVNPIPGTNNRTQYQAVFRVCVDVYAADGSMVTLGPGLAQSHDYGDKAVYQAQQNAIKYLLLEAFAIPTSEQDMDARHPDESTTVSGGEWLAKSVETLEKWSKKERVQAYNAVVDELELREDDGSVRVTPAVATKIFDAMHKAYTVEHPPVLMEVDE